jgi:hypothetical protein
MSILSTYFDKLYCISLAKRPDRWENTQVIFNELGFDDIERYEGIDGGTMDLTKFGKLKMTIGNYGIMQTQFNILNEAKANNYKSILITEDDVFFSDEIHKLKEYMDAVPDDWDMIYFGGSHNHGIPPIKINDKIIKLGRTVSTHCVAVKNTVYDKILKIAEPRTRSIDAYYADLHPTINAYGFTPSMAFQTPGYSDVANQIVDYNRFF